MSHFVPKHEMTEEDIKLQFITPAIMAKWPTNRITMETKITDGKINLRGNMVFRQKPKKADYVLYINANNPIRQRWSPNPHRWQSSWMRRYAGKRGDAYGADHFFR